MHNFYFMKSEFPHIVVLGPGPSRYCLPQCVGYNGHDTTKLRMPAYSFGQRLESSRVSERDEKSLWCELALLSPTSVQIRVQSGTRIFHQLSLHKIWKGRDTCLFNPRQAERF